MQLAVSVTELATFVHRRGDIDDRGEDITTAREGVEAQRNYQAKLKLKNTAYESEVRVQRDYIEGDISMRVAGRIDGLLSENELDGRRLIVEEIKTTRSDTNDIPLCNRSVHEAQLMLYASLIELKDPDTSITTRLTYIHPDTGHYTSVDRSYSKGDLEEFFNETVTSYAQWIANVVERLERRNRLAKEQEFPYPSYNSNQLDFARRGFVSLRDKSNLLIEAPTGTGKTIGTMFPSVKAIGEQKLDRVVFTTARTTGQHAAFDAFKRLQESNDALVKVTVSAKERVCLTPGAACRPEECDYAKGHYDRIRDATSQLLRKRNIDRDGIDAMAKSKKVCPFELSLDAAEWADVVVCDYNYVFDPMVHLSRLHSRLFSRVGLLIDEAHRLTERVRSMLSCSFDMSELEQVVEATRGTPAGGLFEGVFRGLNRVLDSALPTEGETTLDEIDPLIPDSIRNLIDSNMVHLSIAPSVEDKDSIQNCLLQMIRFRSVWTICESSPRKFIWHLTRGEAHATINLCCLLPDAWISETVSRYHGSIRFSGTLSPGSLFNEEHGLDGPILRGKLPPDARRLGAFIVPDISTFYSDRPRTAPHLASLIKEIKAVTDGNWLVAFPSFAYMNLVVEQFDDLNDILIQESQMSLERRDAYLADLTTGSQTFGFIVMGGVFAESIDLDPSALEGVIVISPGIAPRSLVQDRLEMLSESGYELAYRRPAMTRVIQAAGRVVRGEKDRGVVVLIDPRFTRSEFAAYFPNHWQPQVVKASALPMGIAEFNRNV